MSKALSLDLRQRALAALHDEGLSHRETAARFRVSAASISRWRALARDGSEPRPGPLGGDRRSHVIEAHATAILAVFHARLSTAAEFSPEVAVEISSLHSWGGVVQRAAMVAAATFGGRPRRFTCGPVWELGGGTAGSRSACWRMR